jgi:hypothetical protein
VIFPFVGSLGPMPFSSGVFAVVVLMGLSHMQAASLFQYRTIGEAGECTPYSEPLLYSVHIQYDTCLFYCMWHSSCLGRRGRSCRGESETAADRGAALTARSPSIIRVPASVGSRASRYIIPGASLFLRACLCALRPNALPSLSSLSFWLLPFFFLLKSRTHLRDFGIFPLLFLFGGERFCSSFCYAPSWPGLRFAPHPCVRERVFGRVQYVSIYFFWLG